MAGYRLGGEPQVCLWPSAFGNCRCGCRGLCLSNYEMNVKAATTAEDFQGIWIGALGTALIVIGVVWSGYRALKIEDTLNGVMMETAKTTALVFVILLGAAMLTAAFRAFGGEELVREFLVSLPGGFWMQFVIVMLVIFILGFFLDFIEIAVVVVPIVAPILLADPSANITAVWLGVMIGLNIQTSFLTHLWICAVLSARRGPSGCENNSDVSRRCGLYHIAVDRIGHRGPISAIGELSAQPL